MSSRSVFSSMTTISQGLPSALKKYSLSPPPFPITSHREIRILRTLSGLYRANFLCIPSSYGRMAFRRGSLKLLQTCTLLLGQSICSVHIPGTKIMGNLKLSKHSFSLRFLEVSRGLGIAHRLQGIHQTLL